MEHLSSSHFPAFEICLVKKHSGEKLWEQLYNYPLTGICYWHSNLNNQILGTADAIVLYRTFLLPRLTNVLNFRFGIGIGYLSNPFHRLNNYKNIAIGSRMNIAINVMYEFRWTISQRLTLSNGIGIMHFSNGNWKEPNLGINMTTFNIGALWRLEKRDIILVKKEIPELDNKNEFNIITSFGIKEITPVYGEKYPVYVVSGNFARSFSLWQNKRKFGAGVDFFYNTAQIEYLKRDSIFLKHNYEIIKPGINASYELVFDKLSFVFQLGIYLYGKEKKDGQVYHMFALKYSLNKHFFINLGLKTHYAKADFMQCGVGYQVKIQNVKFKM